MDEYMEQEEFHGDQQSRSYKHPDGRTVIRGDKGHWELRSPAGVVLDHDQFRFDLAERNNIELTGWAD